VHDRVRERVALDERVRHLEIGHGASFARLEGRLEEQSRLLHRLVSN
jgi:hypothetical protein